MYVTQSSSSFLSNLLLHQNFQEPQNSNNDLLFYFKASALEYVKI